MIHKKPSGRALSMPAGLLHGTLASLGITLGFVALISKLLDSERIQAETIGYWIMFMLIIATSIGAVISCWKIKRQRVMVCLAAGGIYYLTLLAATALFFGGQFESVGVTGLIIFLSSAAAVFLPFPAKKSRGGKKLKKSNR